MFAVLRRHPLLVILTLAFAVRLVAALAVQSHLDATGDQFLLAGDAEGYWMLADRIASGEEYSVYDPPRRVLRMPGLPLLLASVRLFTGDSLLPVRIVLAIVGTASCFAVYLLGRWLDSERTGLIAATLAACWPVLIGFSVLVLSETLFSLTLVISLALFAKLVRRIDGTNQQLDAQANSSHFPLHPREAEPKNASLELSPPIPRSPFPPVPQTSYLLALAAGVAAAVATYVRPTWLPVAVVFPVAYWFGAGRTKRATVVGLLVVAGAAVTLAPWTIRNCIVTGHWVPTTLWVGPSLYDGLNPSATGASDMRFFDEDRLLDRMSEYEMDREYRRRAWQFAADHPRRTLELTFAKLWRFWRPWPGAEQFSSPAARFIVAVYFLPILALAIVGGWVRRRDLWLVGLTAAPILFFSVVHCLFVGSLRYRLPAEYPLCVLSAVGLQWCFPRLRFQELNSGTHSAAPDSVVDRRRPYLLNSTACHPVHVPFLSANL